MKSSFGQAKFNWLIADDTDPGVIAPQIGSAERVAFPISPDLGQGASFGIALPLGMSLFRGMHQFKPAAAGQLLPLAKIEMTFPEKTFFAESVLRGQLFQRSETPVGEFLGKPGFDVFRMTDRLDMVPILDGSSDVVATSLTVGWSSLCQLLGEPDAEQIQKHLGLDVWPKTCVFPMPLHVAAHLHNALPTSMVGAVRTLHCQARALDYFDALIAALGTNSAKPPANSASKDRSYAVLEFLLHSEGKLPTLDELAMQFGCSARRLNDEFAVEHGQSIYSFMSNHRLDQAHAAILGSDIPLKKLAEKLGYAHFNHFSAAFKKKFGYPPGSLRKGKP